LRSHIVDLPLEFSWLAEHRRHLFDLSFRREMISVATNIRDYAANAPIEDDAATIGRAAESMRELL
jgi:hypothetical protein